MHTHTFTHTHTHTHTHTLTHTHTHRLSLPHCVTHTCVIFTHTELCRCPACFNFDPYPESYLCPILIVSTATVNKDSLRGDPFLNIIRASSCCLHSEGHPASINHTHTHMHTHTHTHTHTRGKYSLPPIARNNSHYSKIYNPFYMHLITSSGNTHTHKS